MSLTETLARVLARHDELRDVLSSQGLSSEQFARLSKEYADLTPVAEAITELTRTQSELADAESMLHDPEMQAAAKLEIEMLRPRIPEMERHVQRMLLPKDIADERNAILEIRAGTGGDEAALFGMLLFEMYRKYAAIRGWRFEIMELSQNDLGGLKEGTATISGKGVFARLKYESGVHRVQRVPQTEASGRVHTSTATVAVLPEMEEVDIKIDDKDLKIDVYRSSGAGGQHVNKTESAIRITHTPTNIVVQCQSDRSQHRNRAQAMSMLKARLYELELRRREEKLNNQAASKTDIGWGHQIRSYVLQPYQMVKDNRTGVERGNAAAVLDGDIDCYLETALAQRIGGEEE